MFELDQEARAFGVTCVENRFLTDYLPAAKGDYVKVYLWGLYACAHKEPDYSLEEMAHELDLSVSDIEAALRYWERRSLVSRISDNPPQYRFFSAVQRNMSPSGAVQADMEYVSFAEAVYAAFGDRRKVKPSEISMAWEWVKDIGLSPEAVLMLLHHCIGQRGVNFSFRIAERLAVSMKEAGVQSPDDAEAFLQHDQAVHEGTRKTLSRMGKRRLPTDDELALYEKWITDWQFEPQAILDACREMTSGDPSFKYLDGILNRLHKESNVKTGTQVQKQFDLEEDEKKKAQEVFTRLGMGRFSGPAAVRQYREMLAVQPHEVLLLAADKCFKTKHNLEDMTNLIEAWKKRGLQTEADVRQYVDKVAEQNALLKEVFEACGHNGRPTEADRKLYEKWAGFGYNQELILCAAEQARSAEANKIGYLNRVLEMWHDAGITDISQARARKKPEEKKKSGKTVSAQQYGQRQYSEEELLAVSDDLIEEARKQRG